MNANSVRSTVADLLAYHRWANRKLLNLCRPLSDEQLDREEPIGPGSLRKILTHMWAGESIWLSRWKGVSPTAFPPDQKSSIEELDARYDMLHAAREGFLHEEAPSDLSRVISYRTFAGDANAYALSDLIMHVANHGVHHRAQAIHLLKLNGVTIPGGLDYIFHRIAVPTVAMPEAARQRMRGYGLEVGDVLASPIRHSPDVIRLYFAYGDWGMERLFAAVAALGDAELDRDFGMGMGTLRKTMLHIYDAEDWWRGNWRGETQPFPKSSVETTIAGLRDCWARGAEERNALVAMKEANDLVEPVTADFGAGPMVFRTGESMLQLGVHGTHHRAQAINMCRRLGVPTKPFDLVAFLRERS